MTPPEPTKMHTKRVKSPDSQVLESRKPRGTSQVRQGRMVKKSLPTLSSTKPARTSRTSPSSSGPSNLLGSKSSKLTKSDRKPEKKKTFSKKNEKVLNSLPVKTFLKTPVKSDVKVPLKNSFFANFLKTKGHLGSPHWTKDMTTSMEGVRQGFAVFDAKKTKSACSRAFHFLKTYRKPLHEAERLPDQIENFSGKKKKLDILFVNTSEQYRHLIQKVARVTGQRYIHEKWVGGTLTNWSQISQSYSLFGRFHSLFGNFLKKRKIHLPLYEKAKRIYSGLLPQEIKKKKTKKDQRISSNLSGIDLKVKELETLDNLQITTSQVSSDETVPEKSQNLSTDFKSSDQILKKWNEGLPDVVFLINPEENQNVLREANLLKIPVIALTDANTKISGIDYMIPGNVQSIKFVYWFLNCMTIILQKRNKRKKKKSITSSSVSVLQTSATEKLS